MPQPAPQELPEIGPRTNSLDILAHGRQQAIKRNLQNTFIVDVDSHIGESGHWPEVM